MGTFPYMATFIPTAPIFGNTARDVSEKSGTGAGTPTPRFQQGSMTTDTLAGIELSGTLAQHDVYVRIQTDLLVIGDSIMTDRHHASNGHYEDDDPQNQIGGIIPAFPLSGWLRHGMEQIVQGYDTTVCHPGEANANFMKDDVYRRSRRLPRGRPKTSGFRDHENRRFSNDLTPGLKPTTPNLYYD